MDLSIEDYPQLLSNIADILRSDPLLGVTLLVSQKVDIDLFVYYLLDNYNTLLVNEPHLFKYDYVESSNAYNFFNKPPGGSIQVTRVSIDDIQDVLKKKLNEIINTY